MARICKKCGKKISMFAVPEIDEQGNVVCQECSAKIKEEQETAQKQKEDMEYKTKLAKALTHNSQWEYKVANLNVSGSEEELTKLGLEGWNLVSAIPITSSSVKEAEGEKKEGEEQKPPQKETTIATEAMVCLFKRKL